MLKTFVPNLKKKNNFLSVRTENSDLSVSVCIFVYRPIIPQNNAKTSNTINRVQIFDKVTGPSYIPEQSNFLGRAHLHGRPRVATRRSLKEFPRNFLWRGILIVYRVFHNFTA